MAFFRRDRDFLRASVFDWVAEHSGRPLSMDFDGQTATFFHRRFTSQTRE
jgi:hypothetical protein